MGLHNPHSNSFNVSRCSCVQLFLELIRSVKWSQVPRLSGAKRFPVVTAAKAHSHHSRTRTDVSPEPICQFTQLRGDHYTQSPNTGVYIDFTIAVIINTVTLINKLRGKPILQLHRRTLVFHNHTHYNV